MLIPGEALWVPRRTYRLPGGRVYNPAIETMRRLGRVALVMASVWVLWLWVTQPIVEPCDEPCVTTTT